MTEYELKVSSLRADPVYKVGYCLSALPEIIYQAQQGRLPKIKLIARLEECLAVLEYEIENSAERGE